MPAASGTADFRGLFAPASRGRSAWCRATSAPLPRPVSDRLGSIGTQPSFPRGTVTTMASGVAAVTPGPWDEVVAESGRLERESKAERHRKRHDERCERQDPISVFALHFSWPDRLSLLARPVVAARARCADAARQVIRPGADVNLSDVPRPRVAATYSTRRPPPAEWR